MSTPNIGIVGHRRAGKTVFIACLERALQWRGWAVTIDPKQGRYLRDMINTLQGGHFPDPTLIRPSYELIEIKAAKGDQTFTLSLVDPAGELFETDALKMSETDDALRRNARTAMMENMKHCSRFIILLDLEHERETFTQTVNNFLAQVDVSRGKLDRAVVLFSKADLLPWQDRYRIRSAEEWVADSENKMGDMVRLVRNHFEECRFEFVSTLGWTQGMPNVRTTFRPRPFNQGNRFTRLRGEHLPDPALKPEDYREGIEHANHFRFMKAMPVFTDPLRIAKYELPENDDEPPMAGVQFFPGRRVGYNAFSPWNVVDPLLWAARMAN